MKDIKLNLTKEQAEWHQHDKDGKGWQAFYTTGKAMHPPTPTVESVCQDWLTFHSAHESDVKLIEQLEKALKMAGFYSTADEFSDHDGIVRKCQVCDGEFVDEHKDDCPVGLALSAVTAWRGEK